MIITEKSGLIKIVNIINNQVNNVEHNLNFLEDGQGGLLDIPVSYTHLTLPTSDLV